MKRLIKLSLIPVSLFLLADAWATTPESVTSSMRNQMSNAVGLVKSQIKRRFGNSSQAHLSSLFSNQEFGLNAGDTPGLLNNMAAWGSPFRARTSTKPQISGSYDSIDKVTSLTFGLDGLVPQSELLVGGTLEFNNVDALYSDSENKKVDSLFANLYLAKPLDENLVIYGLVGIGAGDVDSNYLGTIDRYDTDRWNVAAGLIYSTMLNESFITLDAGITYADQDSEAYYSPINGMDLPVDQTLLGQMTVNLEVAENIPGSSYNAQAFLNLGYEYDYQMKGSGDDEGLLFGFGARASNNGFDFEAYAQKRVGRAQSEDDVAFGLNIRRSLQ
ncbi:MAG: autotransporter outer membrane beta-barrel domain-containing protein [Sedimenticola sp.]